MVAESGMEERRPTPIRKATVKGAAALGRALTALYQRFVFSLPSGIPRPTALPKSTTHRAVISAAVKRWLPRYSDSASRLSIWS